MLYLSLAFIVSLLPQVWLQYQSLWDMESGNIYGRLDTDLACWQKLLMDVKYVLEIHPVNIVVDWVLPKMVASWC